MLLLSHTVTGAIIGYKINNPYLVGLIALSSHFILDRIPHWNYLERKEETGYREETGLNTWKYMEAIPDIVVSSVIFVFFLYSYPSQWINIAIGVIFATLPDFITFTTYFPILNKFFRPFNKLHYILQGKITKFNPTIFGLLTQVIFFVIAIIILKL